MDKNKQNTQKSNISNKNNENCGIFTPVNYNIIREEFYPLTEYKNNYKIRNNIKDTNEIKKFSYLKDKQNKNLGVIYNLKENNEKIDTENKDKIINIFTTPLIKNSKINSNQYYLNKNNNNILKEENDEFIKKNNIIDFKFQLLNSKIYNPFINTNEKNNTDKKQFIPKINKSIIIEITAKNKQKNKTEKKFYNPFLPENLNVHLKNKNHVTENKNINKNINNNYVDNFMDIEDNNLNDKKNIDNNTKKDENKIKYNSNKNNFKIKLFNNSNKNSVKSFKNNINNEINNFNEIKENNPATPNSNNPLNIPQKEFNELMNIFKSKSNSNSNKNSCSSNGEIPGSSTIKNLYNELNEKMDLDTNNYCINNFNTEFNNNNNSFILNSNLLLDVNIINENIKNLINSKEKENMESRNKESENTISFDNNDININKLIDHLKKEENNDIQDKEGNNK